MPTSDHCHCGKYIPLPNCPAATYPRGVVQQGLPINLSRSVPQGQDREHVKRVVDVLCGHQQSRAAAIAQLARATGMRLREAILADLPRLQREAEQLGRVNIQDGTKDGRSGASAPRWITVDEHIRDALAFALKSRLTVAATCLQRMNATSISNR